MGQKRERDGEGAPRRGSKLDAETLAYYAEIDETLQGLEEPEERQLLADNVLGDAEGREVEVATDAACSRVLEKLLPCATTEALCKFSRACVEGDGLGTMCTRCAGGGGRRRPPRLACLLLHAN